MKIEHYISQLLYRHQCVTVPSFGAFLTETRPAYIREESGTFVPPGKSIAFNSYLKNNDGLLANHISKAERLSYEKANALIQSQVDEWKRLLRLSVPLHLKDIGTISLTP